jgi:hypothetical protein
MVFQYRYVDTMYDMTRLFVISTANTYVLMYYLINYQYAILASVIRSIYFVTNVYDSNHGCFL